MQKNTRKQIFRLLLSMVLISVSLSSCHHEPPFGYHPGPYDPPSKYDYGQYVDGTYSVSGYIYYNYPNGSYTKLTQVGLDIEWVDFNSAVVNLYTSMYYLEPVVDLPCRIDYNSRENIFYLYNPIYPEMRLFIYDDGYVYFYFPYGYFNRRDCVYEFEGYYWNTPYYKPAR